MNNVDLSKEPRKLVSIWLDDYDNIFSDFDPRSFSQRELSDDFLNETRKVLHAEKNRLIQLMILVPVGKRNKSDEHVIKNRLHTHFRHTFDHLRHERKIFLRNGVFLTIVGFVLMLLASATSAFESAHYFMSILRVFLEPSGWFAVWYGMDKIFYLSGLKNEQSSFNQTMAKAEITFDSYQPRT